ncbi:uncharacterized protein JCM6883_003341 [Sporobolomyces salmoneus]|uniref:uncharacterized protein n=1 Tax=Sporobolomyces salmoneus TaxID=183962 RepID=UPI0031773170
MHKLALVLTLAAASLPRSFAASHPQGHHHGAAPNPNAHGLFARAPSALVERAAQLIEERGVIDEEALKSLNMTESEVWEYEEGMEQDDDDEAELGNGDTVRKRGVTAAVLNPKWPKNPKWKGGSKSSDSSKTTSSPSASTKISASTTSTKSKNGTGQIIVGGAASGATKTLAAQEPSSSSSSNSSSSSDSASSTVSSSTSASKTSTIPVPTALPSPPSSSCAPAYTNQAGGTVWGPGIGNFTYLPRPSTFVKRNGQKLTLDGETYRIVGPNIYWLGLDENVWPSPSYPDKGRIREAMAATVAMGGNTIRSHTLGISTGNKYSVWPKAYQTNDNAFDTIDYAIYAARNYGLRLLIPLTDNYAYYHGGKYDFIGWAGKDTSDASQFYYSKSVVQMYKDYISVILNHVNKYTGVRLGDDPTILAWETGNELGGYMLGGGAPPKAWTENIAAHILSLAPNTLVADGTDGLVDTTGALVNTGMAATGVDLVTDHFYPALQWLLEKDRGYMSYYSKSFYVGEFDWTGIHGGADLDTFYSTIENMEGSGSMMWSLFGHDAQCCNFVEHHDGYTLGYPNADSSELQSAALKLAQHWYRIRGLTPPSALPAVACPQPELTP